VHIHLHPLFGLAGHKNRNARSNL